MSRFWFGAGLLALLLVLSLWASYAMNRLHQPIADTLEQASDAAIMGDMDEAARLVRQAKGSWSRHRKGTAALASHTPMDQIDALFSQLEAYSRADMWGEFASCCAHLSQLVEATGEAHRLTWWNLL